MSDRFWQVFGHDPSERTFRVAEWQDMIHPDDLKLALKNFEAHCADENHPYDQLVRYQHKDGSTVWVRCRGLVIRDAWGKPIRMLGAHTDVTELKNAEKALAKNVADLAHSNKALEQFAYVASHDLKEPLRMVTSYVEILSRALADRLSEKERKYMAYALDGATRMHTLIHDLLAFSRLNSAPLTRDTFPLNEVLADCLHDLQAAISDENAEVTCDNLPIIVADKIKLHQLFQNLINNGVKFHGDAPPRIHVGVRDQRRMWEFSVRDNGIGMEMEFTERIFMIFQRLHTRTDYPGTGIGLAICKEIVERHGGKIWVTSAIGKGTTFSFTLPKSTAERIPE